MTEHASCLKHICEWSYRSWRFWVPTDDNPVPW